MSSALHIGELAPEAAYLTALNESQRTAVEATEGPVLVLAGAGTGKTRVLTTRLAHILLSGRAGPEQILAVTFTNKAAREMIGRVEALIGRSAAGLWFGTFHALCARILRRHAELVGLQTNFTILDTDDQLRLLRQILSAENIDEKRWPARSLLAIIQRWKDRGHAPDQVPAGEASDFAGGRAVNLYDAYQSRLITLNAVDFGDLLLYGLALLRAHGDVLAEYHRRFRYILVDEYQDTNLAQYLWLRILAQGRHNICCVGDDDQSIYGWRGAEVGNILKFEKDFPGAKIIRLERNYRSTEHILAAASGLIAHNAGRLGKTLWTETPGGDPVIVQGTWDGDEEARLVGEEIESLKRGGQRLEEIAVLVRAGFQTRAFEERFITIGLPYRVIGGLRFYERQEVRDAVAYIRVLLHPTDDLAFERIVNLPKRGLGDATLRVLHRISHSRGGGLEEAARFVLETDELRARARGSLRRLIDRFDRWREQLRTLSQIEVVELMLDESGYTAMWQNDKSPTAPGRLENLKELVRALAEFENLEGFLEHVSLVMDADVSADGDLVNLMTLHGAKGLEFDTVFLPGWEEGLFPHQRALDEKGAAGLEEERRLAYVGLTRARRCAHILYADSRRVYNQSHNGLPSRFIDELPAAHVIRRPISPPSNGWNGGRNEFAAFAGRYRQSPYPVVEMSVPAGAVAQCSFAIGDRIFHQKFGYGRVCEVDGDRLRINFEKAGEKRVVAEFVQSA